MASKATPAIPDVPPGLDEAAAAVLRPLKEAMEIREGLRGNRLDRFVTARELVDWGVLPADAAQR
jgi:hypothetical protein